MVQWISEKQVFYSNIPTIYFQLVQSSVCQFQIVKLSIGEWESFVWGEWLSIDFRVAHN